MSKKNAYHTLILLFLLASSIRFLLALFNYGYEVDTNCFYYWAQQLDLNGFSKFYCSDFFSDYPPGYLYILRILGYFINHFSLTLTNPFTFLLLKLPSCIRDLLTCYLIFSISIKRFDLQTSTFIVGIYLFNPSIILNSSIWGQVDSIFMLFLFLCILCLMENKMISSYFLFIIAVLIKPQALIFTPLLLFGTFSRPKQLLKNIIGGLCAIISFFILCIPFGLSNILTLYTETLGSYPYISVNAYNFWTIFHWNWISQETPILFFNFQQLGICIIILLTIISGFLFYRCRKRRDKFFITGSFLMITMFLFSVRMHERYLYPALLFLLCSFIYNTEKKFLISFGFISGIHFLNVYHVLYFYDATNYQFKNPYIVRSEERRVGKECRL